MKKLFSLFAALALTASAISCVSAFAEEESGTEHVSKTVTIGDINSSGKLDVGDLVTASRFILGEDVEEFSSLLFDVNLDGENDVFDLIGLRKLVLDPENSKIQTYAMDILKSIKELKCEDIKFDNFEDAEAYFNEMLTSNEEIKKFTELYDEEFFKENDLILRPFIQGDNEKILYSFAEDLYNNDLNSLLLKLDDEEALKEMSSEFGSVLAQVTIPKEMSDLITELDLMPLSEKEFPFEGIDISIPVTDEDIELTIADLTDYLRSTDIFKTISDGGIPEGQIDWGSEDFEDLDKLIGDLEQSSETDFGKLGSDLEELFSELLS